jgi:hypothetical protein
VRNASTKTGYSKNSNGTSFAARESWGNWDGVNVVLQTDLDRDGYQDLLYRDSSTGDVYWTSSTTYHAFDAVGDSTGDGKADFLARTPGGTLCLYPGTGKASSEIFATGKSVGTDFKQYDIFG